MTLVSLYWLAVIFTITKLLLLLLLLLLLSSSSSCSCNYKYYLLLHNDAPQSVGLLWTSDLSVAETST
jgi:hypothetical protein